MRKVLSRERIGVAYVLCAVAILALATACGSNAGQATQTAGAPPATASALPSPLATASPTELPTESAAGLVVGTQQLASQPTLDPLAATTVEGQAISRPSMTIGKPFEYQWLDDGSGMWAMIGDSRLVASEHYGDASTGSEGWVAVTRDGEEIYRIDIGKPNPMPGLQGFFGYDGHWVLETNYYTDDEPFDGKITVDGVLLNEQEGYDKAFNAQTIAGKLFYLFQRDGRIDGWYDGQVISLGYEDVPHYACCSGAEMNPYKGQDAVSFFGVSQGTWYLAEIGTPSAVTP